MKRKTIVAALLLACFLFLTACNEQLQLPSEAPIFTDPDLKIAETADPAFSVKLFYEAVALDTNLDGSDTQVHMGYWSRSPNRTSLIKVIDAINAYPSTETHCAILDEGVSTATADQFPSYITMNYEYWYERAYAEAGKVVINGVSYLDPHPVTPEQADQIWGQYSQRYTEMAALFRQTTGITVESWCFVQEAKANRIFYSFEFPKLVSLEANGDVYVYFALTSEADWQDPADWAKGTTNAPTPE
ncbi:MAG: hypothetical protein ABIA67_01980 [Candidatus Margulisiibacteriota bacterium]